MLAQAEASSLARPSAGLNGPTVTVYDSLGTDSVQEVNVDALKWRFFELGVRVGIALQMLFMCVLLMIPEKNDAIDELSVRFHRSFRLRPKGSPHAAHHPFQCHLRCHLVHRS